MLVNLFVGSDQVETGIIMSFIPRVDERIIYNGNTYSVSRLVYDIDKDTKVTTCLLYIL